MQVRVLGPVELVDPAGHRAPLGGARERTVLAVLALAQGDTVSVGRLAEEVWQEELPARPGKALQNVVLRLRSALEGTPVRVVTCADGYALQAQPDDVDLWLAESLLAEAERHSDLTERLARLDRAAALWSGPALSNLEDRPVAALEGPRLEELRLRVLEARGAAALALGRAPEQVEQLAAPCAEHPYRESLWVLRAQALRDAARPADALETLRVLRTALAEDLGLDLGPVAAGLQQSLLTGGEPVVALRPAPTMGVPLVGRDAELGELVSLTRRARVVTLVGPGGVGKTSLAGAFADQHPGEVAWAELVGARDAEQVLSTLAEAVRVDVRATTDPVGALAGALARRRALLVLDNCEHLRAEVADLVGRLLRGGTDLRVLATSREPLRVRGEVISRLAPLAVPPPGASDVEQYASVDLLRRRVADSGFGVGVAAADLARLVRALDGLPLAIELAAPLIGALGVRALLDGLDDRLELLSDGPGATPHHTGLRAALDWSHDLLDEDERVLYRRLGVFRQSFDLADATAVCTGGAVPEEGVAGLVRRLVDRSLLVPSASEPRRFRMLETMREHSRQHLAQSGEETALLDRHAARALQLARDTDPWADVTGVPTPEVTDRLPEMLAAIDHLTDAEPLSALELLALLRNTWFVTGLVPEAARRLERLLALVPEDQLSARLRAHVLELQGIRCVGSDAPGAARLLREAAALFAAEGDCDARARVLARLAPTENNCGKLVEAAAILEELLDSYGEEPWTARLLVQRGFVSLYEGDYAAAVSWGERYLARTGGAASAGVAHALGLMAVAHAYAGDAAESVMCALRGIEAAQRWGDTRPAWTTGVAAEVAAWAGRLDLYPGLVRMALPELAEQDHLGLADFLTAAGVASAGAAPAAAVELLAAGRARYEGASAPVVAGLYRPVERLLLSLREELGPQAFHEAWVRGHGKDVDETRQLLRAFVASLPEEPDGRPGPEGRPGPRPSGVSLPAGAPR